MHLCENDNMSSKLGQSTALTSFVDVLIDKPIL